MSKEPKLYPCDRCPKTFDKPNRAHDHWLKCLEKEHKCEICLHRFNTKKSLSNHTYADHPGLVPK